MPVCLQRVGRFHRPLVFMLSFVWCYGTNCTMRGDSDMAEVLISGEVIYSELKLLAERSRGFLSALRWVKNLSYIFNEGRW